MLYRKLSMITDEESAYYSKLVSENLDCPGLIIDLGCWFGSTSIALAKGFENPVSYQQNPNHNIVYAIDNFIWENWMPKEDVKNLIGIEFKDGDGFYDSAKSIIDEYAKDKVKLIKADLLDNLNLDIRSGIKILLVDAMKSTGLAKSISLSFFEYLKPESYLIHQDYKHFYTFWIHILQYRLRKYFEYFESIAKGGTVVFKLKDYLDRAILLKHSNFEIISDTELDEAVAYSMELINDIFGLSNLAAMHIYYYLRKNDMYNSLLLLARYKTLNYTQSAEFELVHGSIKEQCHLDII